MNKMVMILISLIIIVVLFVSGYFFFGLIPSEELKVTKLLLGDRSIEVEIADTIAARARGLSYRTNLAENKGLYFVFGRPARQTFWMKDMSFPIDIIWIREGKIVGIEKNVEPQPEAQVWQLRTYSPPEDADRVLEVNAGWSDKNGIRAGDEVKLTSD
ncbi:MAG: DUF192 domain-containing protein [Candidatus Liptonbacteria bacterium]